ncbi:hypothetical protein MHYP_G00348300 [Metynnis hypsauchen]
MSLGGIDTIAQTNGVEVSAASLLRHRGPLLRGHHLSRGNPHRQTPQRKEPIGIRTQDLLAELRYPQLHQTAANLVCAFLLESALSLGSSYRVNGASVVDCCCECGIVRLCPSVLSR